MGKAPGFFDFDDRLKRLSDLGDQLEAFGRAVDFEIFRPDLAAALNYSTGERGGRPPFDPVLMFKVLVIQTTNNLSDERTEFLINDRLSFMRFLGLGLDDRVPDARTIWLFREKLTRRTRSRACSPVSRQHCGPPATSPCLARSSTPAWSRRRSNATPTKNVGPSRRVAFPRIGRTGRRNSGTKTATLGGR